MWANMVPILTIQVNILSWEWTSWTYQENPDAIWPKKHEDKWNGKVTDEGSKQNL